MSYRYETIEEWEDARDHCEHRPIAETCANCGGLIGAFCDICDATLEIEWDYRVGDCRCGNPEPVQLVYRSTE